MRTRIKMCGLTTPEDALAAVECGADALGVVLATSPREVTLAQAERVLRDVPPPVARIGVFVDAEESFVAEAVERIGLAAVQFHGSESPGRCAAAPVPVIKALKVGTGFAMEGIEPFRGAVAAILLDTLVTDKAGGTGEVFNWRIITDAFPGWARLFLAGGLHPGNVAEAVRIVRPFAVDVSSGIEAAPGRKDQDKMAAFAEAIRAADEEE